MLYEFESSYYCVSRVKRVKDVSHAWVVNVRKVIVQDSLSITTTQFGRNSEAPALEFI